MNEKIKNDKGSIRFCLPSSFLYRASNAQKKKGNFINNFFATKWFYLIENCQGKKAMFNRWKKFFQSVFGFYFRLLIPF